VGEHSSHHDVLDSLLKGQMQELILFNGAKLRVTLNLPFNGHHR
jgi:hypothetical protein